MSITIELEELKADFLEDLNRALNRGKITFENVIIKEKVKDLYMRFFFDFIDDFPFEHFCIWLQANTGIKIEE